MAPLIRIGRFPVLVVILFGPAFWSQAAAQQPKPADIYILSAEVQQFAVDKDLYQKLDPSTRTVYVDFVTALDIVAKLRTQLLRKDRPTVDEYTAAAWIWCSLPWTPPKTKKDSDTINRVRADIVRNAFTSAERRKAIEALLDTKLWGLSASELSDKRITPLAILNTAKVESPR